MWIETVGKLTPGQRATLAARINTHNAEGATTQLMAYVVTEGDVNTSDLRDHLAAHLPAHMLPARIVLLDALPITPNGKIDRNALPDPDEIVMGDDTASMSEFIAPRNDIEHKIVAVWRDLLGMDELSVSDDFFELGGHSLLVTRAVARLRETFGVQLPVNMFFEHPTIAGLAERVAVLQTQHNATTTQDNDTNDAMEEIEL